MKRKTACKQCHRVCVQEQDISRHPFLMTVYAREMTEEKSDYLFFCKECYSLLLMTLTMDNPMDDHIEEYKGGATGELTKYFALALVAENRRELIQQRIEFLGKNLMPIYEPIDEKEWERIVKGEEHAEKIVQTPYFPQWHDNIEDALDSPDYEEEWEEGFTFSYADPQDLHIVSSPNQMPRFFRTYLVPADEVEPILRIERNVPARMQIWKQSLSRIEKISIWDDEEGKHLSHDEFVQSFGKEELFLRGDERVWDLNRYEKWIEENTNLYKVAN